MNSYPIIQDILRDDWGISPDQLSDGDVALDDLGIDSLDLLNLVHSLETRLDIKIPIQEWIRARNEGDPEWEGMTLKSLSARIDGL
jgi:acyl carrier protein